MAKSPTFFDPRTLARLSGLQVRARRIVEGYVAGLHRSPYRGFSIEFAEHREYVPGDDLRYVDWKAFGRTDKIYLKQFEDETNLICYLVVDISQSMQYGSDPAGLTKFAYAQCAAAALAWLVLLRQDAVGLVTFDEQVRTLVRPSSEPSHLQQILRTLEQAKPREKTSTGPVFHELAERFQRRGLVIVLSDLFDDPHAIMAGLRHFVHRQHDVAVLHIMDPAEVEFRFAEPTLFRGLEGQADIAANPSAVRRAYLEEIERFLKALRSGSRRNEIDYQLLRCDQPLDLALNHFLTRRARAVK